MEFSKVISFLFPPVMGGGFKEPVLHLHLLMPAAQEDLFC